MRRSSVSVVEFEVTSTDEAHLRDISRKIRALQQPKPEVVGRVAEIVESVRDGGDSSLIELIERYDGVQVDSSSISVGRDEMVAALENLDYETRQALEVAAKNVRQVAEAEILNGDIDVVLDQGQMVTKRAVAVRKAAAYIPGGRAPYPSTVVMTCVPASVAGVKDMAICSPPNESGRIPNSILAAAAICDVDRAYCMGGAHAITALALGTESVEPVDVIVGPGNAYVQEAKRQLYGQVGMDSIAGPSELFVIADKECNIDDVALDLLAQSEHGPESLLVLAGPDSKVLESVVNRVKNLRRSSQSATEAPIAVVKTETNELAARLSEELAPEHLELACADCEEISRLVSTAGCVFIGRNGAAAFGDYVAGSNHVLPTGGAARFSSALAPSVFTRTMSLVAIPDSSVEELVDSGVQLARTEGFDLHADSMLNRANQERDD